MDDEDEIIDVYETGDLDITDKEYDVLETTSNLSHKTDVEDIISFMKNYETNKKKYKSTNVLSKYEKTRILCERAQQLEDGSQSYISNIERFTSSYAIALEEFNTKKIPFIIRRSIPHSNHYEYWKLKDMIF
jgi:DNA-directed RNA polymerase subunit K/omega